MKLPVAVEAKVADELRSWLASELEQLDASSTNQFAHHVVTILLHEDLDLEDEPLTSGDDFLTDIFSIRQKKTRDKQKKAAVQFLRNAVCCDEACDANIQLVVEELMLRIDATKSKMQSRKASKRSLLVPLAVNVDSPFKKNAAKKCAGAEEQRYNEAFPSLSGDESSVKGTTVLVATTSPWNKSPGLGKENQKKRVRRRIGSRCTWLFRSAEEASACDIARETAAVVLEDSSFSAKEAMEVWAPSHTSSAPLIDPPTFCWKSAFNRTSLMTRPFSPSSAPLQLQKAATKYAPFARRVVPVILGDRACLSHPDCPHMDALSHLDRMGFLPISRRARWRAREQRKMRPPDRPISVDSEVRFYLCIEESSKRSEKDRDFPQSNEEFDDHSFAEEIEGPASFPTHYGSYWQDLISQGGLSLYPAFVAAKEEDSDGSLGILTASCEVLSISSNDGPVPTTEETIKPSRYKQLDPNENVIIGKPHYWQDDLTKRHARRPSIDIDLDKIFSLELQDILNGAEDDSGDGRVAEELVGTISHTLSNGGQVGGATGPDLLPGLEEAVSWDSPWYCSEWEDINHDILARLMGTKPEIPNPFLPPRLASCVTSEHSQFLQSAFVNAIFSSPRIDIYSQAWKPPVDVKQKANFVQFLDEDQFIRPRVFPVELVKGCTCSNWLENNCKQGLLCPFSHPSI